MLVFMLRTDFDASSTASQALRDCSSMSPFWVSALAALGVATRRMASAMRIASTVLDLDVPCMVLKMSRAVVADGPIVKESTSPPESRLRFRCSRDRGVDFDLAFGIVACAPCSVAGGLSSSLGEPSTTSFRLVSDMGGSAFIIYFLLSALALSGWHSAVAMLRLNALTPSVVR